jgi:hypothetical protein
MKRVFREETSTPVQNFFHGTSFLPARTYPLLRHNQTPPFLTAQPTYPSPPFPFLHCITPSIPRSSGGKEAKGETRQCRRRSNRRHAPKPHSSLLGGDRARPLTSGRRQGSLLQAVLGNKLLGGSPAPRRACRHSPPDQKRRTL